LVDRQPGRGPGGRAVAQDYREISVELTIAGMPAPGDGRLGRSHRPAAGDVTLTAIQCLDRGDEIFVTDAHGLNKRFAIASLGPARNEHIAHPVHSFDSRFGAMK
jgi:hypothetical protein